MSSPGDLALAAAGIFARLLDRALAGDKAAQRKVWMVLPKTLHTKIVREAERRKDARKFGHHRSWSHRGA